MWVRCVSGGGVVGSADLCLSHHVGVGAHLPIPVLAPLLPDVLSESESEREGVGENKQHNGA